MSNYKKLTSEEEDAIEKRVFGILQVSSMSKSKKLKSHCNSTASGIFMALEAMGYGYFGKEFIPHMVHHKWNLKWWFGELKARFKEELGDV